MRGGKGKAGGKDKEGYLELEHGRGCKWKEKRERHG